MKTEKLFLMLVAFSFVVSGCATLPNPVDRKSAALIGRIQVSNVSGSGSPSISEMSLKGLIHKQSVKKFFGDHYFVVANIPADTYYLNGIIGKKANIIQTYDLEKHKCPVQEGEINFFGEIMIYTAESGGYYRYGSSRKTSIQERRNALLALIKQYPDKEWSKMGQDEIGKINEAEAHYKTAQTEFMNKQYNKALESINKAISLVPNYDKYHYIKGLIQTENKQLSMALLSFNKAVEINSSYPDAYFSRGLVYEKKADLPSALRDYQSASDALTSYNKQVVPKNGFDYYHIGMAYLEDTPKNYDAAIKNLLKSIEVTKNFMPSYYTLGYCYAKKKDYSKSTEFYLKYMKFSPESAGVYNYIGDNYLSQKAYKKAIEYYSKCIEKKNNDYFGYAQRAFCWLKMNNLQNAFDDIMKAIQIENKKNWLYVYQGQILMMMDQNNEAMESLNKAIEMSEKSNFRAYYQRSVLYRKLGDEKKAETDLSMAKGLNKENAPYEYNEE